MGLVPGYDNDVFISYSHIDNEPLGGAAGWVDVFHEHLQNFVNVRVGRRTRVWRDKRLTGAEVFSDEIEQQLRRSAVLISVVSPGYLRSEWCNRELAAFTRAAQERGSLRVGNLQRVVKVLRLPVDRTALPSLLDDVLGGQFYRVDEASGRARDLLLDPGADSLQIFRARVDDVAHDLSRLLEAMTSTSVALAPAPVAADAGTIFLAWTTADLSEEREMLRRELDARGYRVVPADSPPLETAGVRERVLAALSGARLAIHLIGGHYGFVPEGDVRSVIELQSDDELYRASRTTAARIFWLAPNVPAIDPRLSALVERLQQPTPHSGSVDVLANQTIESLKTLVLDRLMPRPKAAPAPAPAASIRVYIVCDRLDESSVGPIQDFLFDQSLEVRLPLFDGESDDIRADHYETLKECDGVLVFWGQGNEGWLRTMLRDVNKVFGLGRTAPYKAASLYLADPPNAAKDRFRTRELSVIRPDRETDRDGLRSFVAQLCGLQA